MSTVLTASVWGQGRAAVALSAQVVQQGLKEDEEECHICRDDIPATIAFVPCKHKVCFGCVENMRAKNIFKADKGIKCPFCRQYVDGYRSMLPPNPAVQKFLQEANKAANIAAQARAVAERKAMGLPGPPAAPAAASSASSSAAAGASRPQSAGSSAAAAAAGEDQTWNCGSCGRTNFVWREFCSYCKKPCANPYAADKLSQTKKDLSVVSRDELVGYIRDQGGFCLRKGLRDMGVSLDGMKSYGSVQSVREATGMFGLKKRVLHIAGLLCDADALRDASLSSLGNIGVQRVFESMAKLRLAFPPDRPNKDLEEWKVQHEGRDPFACMLSALLSRALEFCLHDKGVYVAQCAANLASNSELVAMAKVVFPLALPVSRDPRGVFVLLSLLDLFSQRMWEDAANCPLALETVDLLCNQFACSDKQLLHTCHHALSGKVLVRAIAVSMPRTPALKLAVKIASHASALATTPGGLTTLMELMQLYGHNQQAAEGMRDVVAMMCYSLQGQMNRFAVAGDEAAQEMLLCLVERLGHEQEVAWLDSIAQELVGSCDALADNLGGMEILKFTLSQPCMDLDTISTHIADMKAVLGKKAVLPVVADVMERVASNPPPAAPKYPAASIIQPELKYLLQQGWPTPLPPPPPPRPGEDGYEEYAAQAAARAEAQAAAAAKARAEKEAAAKARREAAAAEAAANASSSAHGGSAAVLDAWSTIRAAGVSSASAWDVGPITDITDTRSAAAGEQDARAGGAAAEGSGSGAASNPWASALQGSQANGSSANPWGDSWGTAVGAQQQQQAAGNGLASPALAAAASVSVPFSVPIAVPLAVPTPAPATQTQVASVPAAAQPRMPFSVPLATPIAAPAAAQPAAQVRSSLPPLPQQAAGGAFRRPPAGGIAVADFSSAAPARLQPGNTPSVLSSNRWPAPQQAGQMAQQQQQQVQRLQQPSPPQCQQVQQQSGSAPTAAAQQQQQQQEGPWSCPTCTYEHSGLEAPFLFCAMCSSQRPA